MGPRGGNRYHAAAILFFSHSNQCYQTEARRQKVSPFLVSEETVFTIAFNRKGYRQHDKCGLLSEIKQDVCYC